MLDPAATLPSRKLAPDDSQASYETGPIIRATTRKVVGMQGLVAPGGSVPIADSLPFEGFKEAADPLSVCCS
jgi:hypothetical protein